VVEVEQRKALEHPRRRGHPRGMWVEAIAHRSFSSTGRAEKLGRRRRSPTRWGRSSGRWVLCQIGEREQAQINNPRRKVARGGGLRAPLTVEEFATAEAAGQRRWRARTVTRCSDSNVVGFGHRRRRGRDGRTRSEARRGDGAARTTERRCRNGAVGRCLYGTAWARGSHAATARRQAGPARQTAADRWAPHVSDF
jgi:hypothetical protein